MCKEIPYDYHLEYSKLLFWGAIVQEKGVLDGIPYMLHLADKLNNIVLHKYGRSLDPYYTPPRIPYLPFPPSNGQ